MRSGPSCRPAAGLLLELLLVLLASSWAEPCTKYGCPGRPHYEPFVPAPPGHTPRCAKPGDTFCETPDHYPKQLIKFLVDKCSFDFASVLRDESNEDFNTYSSHPGEHPAYDYRPPLEGPLHSPPLLPYIPFRYPPANPGKPALVYGPVAANDTQWQGYVYSAPRQRTSSSSSTTPERAAPSKFHRNFQLPPVVAATATAGGFYQPTQQQQPNPSKQRQNRWTSRYSSTPAPRTFWENPFLQTRKSRETRGKRQANNPDSIDICPTSPQYIVPRAALNNQGNWMYVVNLENQQDKYTQIVRSEICTSNSCNGLCSLPEGYTSKCQQQYVQKRLVALEGSGDRLYTDVFWFPHGCSCQVTLNG